SPNQPALDPQVLSQELDVRDQVMRRVGRKVGRGIAGVWCAPPRVALVEQNDPISGGIEVPAEPGRATRSGPAVENDGWLPLWISADLPVDELAIPHVEHPVLVRLDLRVTRLQGLILSVNVDVVHVEQPLVVGAFDPNNGRIHYPREPRRTYPCVR